MVLITCSHGMPLDAVPPKHCCSAIFKSLGGNISGFPGYNVGASRERSRRGEFAIPCSPNEATFSSGVSQQQQNQQGLSISAARTEYMASTDIGGNDSGGAPPHGGDGKWDGSGGDPSPYGGTGIHPLALLIHGIRGKLAADPYFVQKLLTECGLDAAIIIGVNAMGRRERFFRELEFTLCQLAISLLSDFAIVYLLAPSINRPPAITGILRARLNLNGLPAHVFQISPIGAPPYTLGARGATFMLKGLQYGLVGLFMGALGASSVHALIRLRERFDPSFVPPKTVQSIVGTGTAWSGFMATSSNIRYNLVTILEDLAYMKGPRAGQMGSFALRLLNNWAGAAQWVKVTEVHNIKQQWEPSRLKTH